MPDLFDLCKRMNEQMFDRYGVEFTYNSALKVMSITRYGKLLKEFYFGPENNEYWKAIEYIVKMKARIKERKAPRYWRNTHQ